MAAVQGSEMFEIGWEQDANRGGKELIKTFDIIDERLLKIAKDAKAVTKLLGTGKGVQNFKKLTQELEKTTKATRAAIKVDSEKEKLEKKLSALRTKAASENAVLTEQIRLQRKAIRDTAKELVPLSNAYDRLVRNTDKAQKNLKRLAAEFGVNSKQAKAAAVQFDKLDKELRSINATAKDGKRDVGRYGDAIKGAGANLKSFAAAIGLVGGIRLFTSVIRNSFNVIKDFDSAVGNLAAISGKTAEELEPLIRQSKELGASTRFTAGEVSGLQLNLTKLGFLPGQIQNMTEPILNLSSALGADLGEAAALTGATLNAFALEATDAGRVTDVLVKAANSAAVDFAFFNTALSTVGPTANAVGVTLEETSALLATMANSGVDASSASTGLRNIFLTLAKTGQPLGEALDKILNSSNQAATAFDLFGKRGASLGVILANNQAATADLSESLLEAGGTAKEVADKQLDTLQGSLDLLKSAWEGFILGADGASGASESLKVAIKFLADNLDVILKTTLAVIGAFIGFKVLKSAVGAIQGMSKAFGILNVIMTANPIGLIIVAVGALIALFVVFRKEIGDVVTSFVELFTTLEGLKTLLLAIFAPMLLLVGAMEKQEQGIKKLTKEQIRNNKVNKEALKQGKEILKQNKDEIADVSILIDALIDENTTREEKAEIIAKLKEDFPDIIKNINLETASTEALIAVKKDLIKQILVQAIQVKKAEAQGALTGRIIELELQKIGSGKKGIAELDRQIKELTLSLPLIEEIAQRVTNNLQKTVDSIDLSSSFREQNKEIRKLQEELKQLNVDLTKATAAEDEQRIEITKKRIKEITRRLQLAQGIRTTILDDALDKEKDINAQGVADFADSEAAKTKILQTELEKRDQMLLDARSQLQKDLEDQLKENQDILDQNAQDEQDRVDKINADQEKFADQQLAKKKKIRDDEKKADEAAVKAQKEAAKELIKIIDSISEAKIAQIDSGIEAEKREIATSESRIDKLEEAARQGNITAQESIKAEEERIAQSEREISELEKKKANLLAFIVGLKLLGQLIDSGDNNAVTNASAQMFNFKGSLPTFIEGTGAGTIADALGSPPMKGEDGYMIRADGREKILNPKQAAMTGNLSADEIAYGAMRWNDDNRKMMSSVRRPASIENNTEAKLDEVIAAVKDIHITEHHTSVDAMRNMATIVVKDTNKIERTHKREGGVFS